MAQPPPIPPFDGRPFERIPGYNTVPIVTAITPNAGRVAGGTSVTITGLRFRNLPDGSSPTVTFIAPDGTEFTATSVVVVNDTTITANTPATTEGAGVYDVKIAIDTESGTLFGGFTYYETVVLSVDPEHGPIAGGTTVTIKGLNFEAGSTVTFGGSAATGVDRLDDETISATTPNHAQGFVDVVVTGASGSGTLRNGFKYTLLTRGEDIRRQPGVGIQDSLNNTPNIASFTLDGDSHTPELGEQIELLDTEDSNRRLFGGNIQGFSTEYEGQTHQIVWRCTAIDYTGLLNKYYPFGYFKNVSATDVVKFLVMKFAPGFSTTFVQTNLAKVTILLDGSKDFATVLTEIAQLIGSGHWYCDYDQGLHFFRMPKPDSPIAIVRSGPGSAMVIAEGNPIPAAFSFEPGYYSLWSTFVYDNGIESALSPLSNFAAFDGINQFDISALPIGATIGARSVTKRRIYYYSVTPSGHSKIARFVQVNNNTTTAFTTWFGATGASDPDVVAIASNVALPTPPAVTSPAGTATPISIFNGGGTATLPPATDFSTPPSATRGYTPGPYAFKAANIYRDGTESLPTPTSNIVSLDGVERALLQVPAGSTLNSIEVVARIIYGSFGSSEQKARTLAEVIALLEEAQANGTLGSIVGYGDAARHGNAPIPRDYNSLAQAFGFSDIDALLAGEHTQIPPDWSPGRTAMWALIPSNVEGQFFISPGMGGPLKKPAVNPENPGDEVPVWPNPDGPNPEDTLPIPDPLNESSNTILRDPQFTVSADKSQLRNRVYVYGAATQSTTSLPQGSARIDVAELTMFAPGGGWLVVKGHRIEYTTINAPSGEGSITLKHQLPVKIDIGEPVQIAYRADDIGSQEAIGKIELDVNGNPTDGVHEYVIVDPSLKTQFELFMRAFAELELFGRPIITINYATRDVKTRSGATISVDMTNPPVKGDFLIQDVTIDQFHDESDELMPRYNVRATTARFDLDDLLLKIIEGSIDNPTNPTAALTSDEGVTGLGEQFIDQQISGYSLSFITTVGATGFTTVGGPTPSVTSSGSTSNVLDQRGLWRRHQTGTGSGGTSTVVQAGLAVRLDNQPVFLIRVRISRFDNVRIWCGFFNESMANSDTPSGTARGFGFRWSPGGGDTGPRLITWIGTGTLVLGDSLPPLIGADEYLIRVCTRQAGALGEVDINGRVATIPIGQTLRELTLFNGEFSVFNTAVTTTKTVDMLTVGCQQRTE